MLLELPLLIPLTTAAVSLVAWRSRRIQRWLAVLGAVGLLAATLALLERVSRAGIQVIQIGGWPAPFGITLVADLFSAIMVVLAGLLGLSVVVYSLGSIDRRREAFGYYPLLQVLLLGVCGAFLTGDVFNLYVWVEVTLIASFALLALGGERPQLEGAIKYVTLNLVGSSTFLAAVGLLYGLAGTLNMADLAGKLRSVETGPVTVVAMLFFVAIGVKAAIFPLFFWLPASYHTPPVAVTTIFSGLLTKVGVYALIRLFTLVFVQDVAYTHRVILIVAGLTMVTGVLGAVAQYEVRRLLSFHIVSQIGYLLMGLGLFTPLGLAGSVYFMIHYIPAKSALFMVSGLMHRVSGTYDLKKLAGLYSSQPLLAALFLVPALSLAGVPPLSGFFAKLTLLRAGLEAGQYAIAAAAVAVSLLTLYSMIKIWTEAFWRTPDGGEPSAPGGQPSRSAPMTVPTAALAAWVVVVGLAAGPVFALAERASEQLMDPTGYVQAVLGG